MANQPSFMKDFIDLYHEHKCLWKIKDAAYANRALRTKAYEELVELYKTVDNEATVETVKHKINNMRSAFRKEMKKVKMSKRSGASADEIYTPSLWYYNDLLFTADHEECRETLSTCVDIQDESEKGDNEENAVESDLGNVEVSNSFSPSTTTSETTYSSRTPTPTTRKQTKRTKNDVMVEKAYEVLSRGNNEFNTVGANVAWKLQRMEEHQRNIAEHLINTILHYGITKKLTDNVTINLNPPNTFSINAPYNTCSQYPINSQMVFNGSQPSQLQHYTQPQPANPQQIQLHSTSFSQSSTPLQLQSCSQPQLRYQPQSPNQSQPQLHTQPYSQSHTPPQTEPHSQLYTHSQSQSTQHLNANDTDISMDDYIRLQKPTHSGL